MKFEKIGDILLLCSWFSGGLLGIIGFLCCSWPSFSMVHVMVLYVCPKEWNQSKLWPCWGMCVSVGVGSNTFILVAWKSISLSLAYFR